MYIEDNSDELKSIMSN